MNQHADKHLNYKYALLTTVVWLLFIAAGLTWMINFSDATGFLSSAARPEAVVKK